MTTEQWAVLLTYLCAPAANVFWLAYGLSAPWYRTVVGYAVIISKLGLAGLVDAGVLFHIHGSREYPYHDQLILVSFGLITVGTWVYLVALTREQYLKRHRRRRA